MEPDKKAKANEVKFESKDIANREKPNYFDGQKSKNPVKKFIAFAFKGFHKYITIGIIVIVVAAVTALTLGLMVWSPSGETGGDNNTSRDDAAWERELAKIKEEADNILNSDREDAYDAALAFYDEKIAGETGASRVADLKIARASFVNSEGENGSVTALMALLEVDEGSLTNAQLENLWEAIRQAFIGLGDEGSAGVYQDKIDQLKAMAENEEAAEE